MKTIVALPGEGIGPEVVDATCELLIGTGLPLNITTPPQGALARKSHGVPLPDETKRAARVADGVLFGAAGGPDTSAVVAWLRWEMGAWGGVRLIKYHPGMRSPLADPGGIDYVIVRENSEGLYPGREGDLADLSRVMPDLSDRSGRTLKEYGEGRFAVKVVTPVGAERIARFACTLAKARRARGKPGKVTCVTKSNVMPRSDGFFKETAERIVREAGLEFEHFYVDDAARRLVRFPESMDVVLSMNLYADILSDLGAETAGGLGLAPSGCFGDDGWAYFESVHGSAPDIAGKGIANPTATIRSAAMMLEHMGLAAEGERLEAAVARVYRDGKVMTPDQGGAARTRDMAQAVLAAYRNA
jgi:isocitrate/isopropylmalate dehydrogenase